MSTAVYPQGMRPLSSSGYAHHSTTLNAQYIPWKGTGINQFPIGTAPGHIRPLTNNDPGNNFRTKFGLPRPIKHYRKGRRLLFDTTDRNVDRLVKSSTSIPLGGSSSSSGLLNDMIGAPGSYTVFMNSMQQPDQCNGIGIVASYKPNNRNLSDNPDPTTVNPVWCCNPEYTAKQRVKYASTNLNKNYYTTTKQYLQNRCKTYEQKAFNFVSNTSPKLAVKPGSPLAHSNTYLANCQSNLQLYQGSVNAFICQIISILINEQVITQLEADHTQLNTIDELFIWIQQLPENQKIPATIVFEVFINNPHTGITMANSGLGCQLTTYKPNNYQYATQGAVSSSTRMLKLNVSTISSNAASFQHNNNTGPQLITANELNSGNSPSIMNLLKLKSPITCNQPWPLNFSQSGKYQNKKMCSYPNTLPTY